MPPLIRERQVGWICAEFHEVPWDVKPLERRLFACGKFEPPAFIGHKRLDACLLSVCHVVCHVCQSPPAVVMSSGRIPTRPAALPAVAPMPADRPLRTLGRAERFVSNVADC